MHDIIAIDDLKRHRKKQMTNIVSPPPGYGTYDEEYHCPRLIQIFAQGHSIAKFCSEAGISHRTFNRWVDRHDNFFEAYELAKQFQATYYHERLLDAMDSKEANLPAILAGAKIIAGLTGNRPLKLKGLKKDASFKEQYECLLDNVSSEEMEASEAKAFADILAVGVKIDEATVQKERIDRLEEQAGLG